jgi:hypothetical protein
MRKRPDARALLYERIRTAPPKFVHVTGVPYTVEVEVCADPEKLDHVWMTMEVPPFGRIRGVLNTTSRLARDAGLDPRVYVGIISSTWTEKPQTGLDECEAQSYAQLEAAVPVPYAPYDQPTLSELLVTKMKAAVRAEVWGDLYARDHLGVHQIHSRRRSAVVSTDFKAHDGALKLYFAQDNLAELFLFKFAGQP